jgi:glycerol transport system ATP-binding protein
VVTEATAVSTSATPESLRVTGFGAPGEVVEFLPGALNVVLGRNGAGKTSLCRLVAGLERAGAATVRLGDRDLTRVDARRRGVGLVFGEFVNYPGLTVAENIAMPLRAAGIGRDEVRERVAEMASRTGLAGMLDRLPEALSGGQQQRVALARAMARRPAVLLLDEPLANLDYKLREAMEEELRALFSGSETVVVYTTSDPREALQLADRLVLLHEGRPVGHGAPLMLLRNPGSILAADLLSDPGVNLADAELSGATLRLPGGPVLGLPPDAPAMEDGAWRVAVRPDHLRLLRDSAPEGQGIEGEVLLAETTGSDTYLHVLVGEVEWVAHVDGLHALAPGEHCRLTVDPRDVLLFRADGTVA